MRKIHTFGQWLLISSISGWCLHAKASGLDLSLGNQAAQLVYLSDTSSLNYGGADFGMGIFYNDAADYVLHGSMMVVGNLGDRKDIALGVGAKLYAAKLTDKDDTATALAIGGQFRYLFAQHTPMGMIAELYVAPDITAFDDTKLFRELNLRMELEVLPSTRGYIGYRNMNTKTTDTGTYELDDSLHVGVRIQF